MSTTPRAQRTRQQIPERTLSVRMYDVGFGDCFMLRIPKPDGKTLKVLFDCGSIKLGANPIKAVVRQVIEDSRDAPNGRPRIDVVIATHRHRDHISGFEDPVWADVDVGEVWMPWTEKPDDPQGRQIRETHNRLATQLVNRLQLRMAEITDQAGRAPLETSLEMALNALSNEAAMRTLYQGFAGQPVRRFLPEKRVRTAWFATPHLPDVTVHVLGPSRDPEVIRDLDPPAGQSYLKLIEMGDGDQASKPRPFGEDWVVPTIDYESSYPTLSQDLPLTDREMINKVGDGLDEAVAAVLDKALNGTSLMLVFQIGSATLLFPGDAQWGTWRMALESEDFRKLLEVANFYKVGHHGSENATPVEFIKKIISTDFWAMISTNSVAQWPRIPKKELIDALNEKTKKVVRSDQLPTARKKGFVKVKDSIIEAKIPF